MGTKFLIWISKILKIPVKSRHFFVFGRKVYEVSPTLSALFVGSTKEHCEYFVRKGNLLLFSKDELGQAQELLEEDTFIIQHND